MGEKACAWYPGEWSERKSMHSQGRRCRGLPGSYQTRKLWIASLFSKLPALASFCSVGTNSLSPLTQESKIIPKVGREMTVSTKLVCTASPLIPRSYPKGLRPQVFLSFWSLTDSWPYHCPCHLVLVSEGRLLLWQALPSVTDQSCKNWDQYLFSLKDIDLVISSSDLSGDTRGMTYVPALF